jgi:hypothetical protein
MRFERLSEFCHYGIELGSAGTECGCGGIQLTTALLNLDHAHINCLAIVFGLLLKSDDFVLSIRESRELVSNFFENTLRFRREGERGGLRYDIGLRGRGDTQSHHLLTYVLVIAETL